MQGNKTTTIEYLDIQTIEVISGFLGDKLKIVTHTNPYLITGFKGKEADNLQSLLIKLITSSLNVAIQKSTQALQPSLDALESLRKKDSYICNYDVQQVMTRLGKAGEYLQHDYFDETLLPDELYKSLKTIIAINRNGAGEFKETNEAFIHKEMKSRAEFFHKLEKNPLTSEQKRAVIVNEDRNLLVAAAGSGKSSTIVAKVIYLLDKQLAKPDEILVLTYNKDAQMEIDSRLSSFVGVTTFYNAPVKSKTFHGYGYEIISKAEGKAPSISKMATGSKHAQLKLFSNLVEELVRNNPAFRANWYLFNLLVKTALKDPLEFENEIEYKHYLRQLGAELKQSADGSSRLTLLAVNGMQVKSLEELRLVNWLVLKGVQFEYERRYPFDTATVDKRQYFPDFFYPNANLYHEHFALNKDGRAPEFFPNYEDGVKWKRELHNECKTKLIETHSANFYDGSIFDKLEGQLKSNGVIFTPLSQDQLDNLVKDSFNIENDTSLITSFIRHFKANQLSINQLRDKVRVDQDPIRTKLFINIFEEIYKEYQYRLAQEDAIDFEDQVILAAKHLKNKTYHHPFKYILVDEFQDISQDRKLLIDAMLHQRPEAKLFAVGDDWQSIYRFSGSDINLMTNFPEHFGYTAINYLTKTFRSYQRIVDVATDFIQKNPGQLTKVVSSILNDDKDRVFIRGFQSDDEQEEIVGTLLGSIHQIALRNNEKLSVYLLGRYRGTEPDGFSQFKLKYPKLDISFKTIHESKGLESDYVIVLSVTDKGNKSFPTSMSDDPLLHLVIPQPEIFEDAEERRLMYVALTRAKRAVYLLADKNNRSPFANELAMSEKVNVPDGFNDYIACSSCGTGHMVKRRGKFGVFMSCSNYPDCKHSEKLTNLL